jgi:hypothetical protein
MVEVIMLLKHQHILEQDMMKMELLVNLGYDTGEDLAQSTGEQTLCESTGNDNDQSCLDIKFI